MSLFRAQIWGAAQSIDAVTDTVTVTGMVTTATVSVPTATFIGTATIVPGLGQE